ncbi:MAG TPA: homoserine O-acetyltransferase [Saprospiraceae bacterium]|nr:homoserine O-acetyltransferase [Saprospiraceae bacterium]
MTVDYLKVEEEVELESGAILAQAEIAYCTYGTLNETKDNVVWVAHALTGNAEAHDWWSGLVGEGRIFDPERHFIVCANMLGSCYGSSGPASTNPETGQAYGLDFPLVSIRDMVAMHQRLATHLGIEKIHMGIGGSMGGQQMIEWGILKPDLFEHLCILASNAKHSPWGIAFNEAQRMAIEASLETSGDSLEAGRKGLEAARAIAMLSYRHYKTYVRTQSETTDEKLDDFRASSYQRYQGSKLWHRFNVYSYLILSKAMDSHNVGRGRYGIEKALAKVKAKTLVIGIQSDILFPIEEQMVLANHIPNAQIELLDSIYGHDGFLVEFETIADIIQRFTDEKVYRSSGQHYKSHPAFDQVEAKQLPRALPGTERF